ncbi:hypothetical protein HYR99_12450 [Candidatus Poribacteria bacterium]|nr:hypothetical protein [Candidatus Poribacteria bacterium]
MTNLSQHTHIANQTAGYTALYYRYLYAWALFTLFLYLRYDGGLVGMSWTP